MSSNACASVIRFAVPRISFTCMSFTLILVMVSVNKESREMLIVASVLSNSAIISSLVCKYGSVFNTRFARPD